MKIRIILTGGTIDQTFNPNSSPKSFVYDKTHINEMLAEARSKLDQVIEDLMAVNSEDMNEEHLTSIVDSCNKSAEDRIVILHGTNTMAKTAKKLSDEVNDKTIVLTGAMVPFALSKSDALFNLGSALTAVQLLDEGIYVVMNGNVFDGQNVEKNYNSGEFSSITD